MTQNIFEKVAVHDFAFHADEVVAVAAIRVLYGEPEEIRRISARDKEAIAKAQEEGFALVDVGGGEFDHHGKGVRENTYANGVIRSALGKVLDQAVADGKLTAEQLEVMLMNGLYDLQARDNGQDVEGVTASPFGFVHWLNGPEPADSEDQEWRFLEAVNTSKKVFSAMVRDAEKAIPEHGECIEAFEAMDENGVADFPHHMGHSVLECQMWNASHPEKEVKFFTFPTGRGTFMVQGVNKVGKFALNHSLPHKGLKEGELNEAAGIQDGVFVHINGFIGSAVSLASCHILAGQAED